MARQIQIRRGTATEHENFTGAIGEITMDTTNKTLRVHDGETVGGTRLAKQDDLPDFDSIDYVIDTWRSSDGNSWYRKYKSGWIEQGGFYSMSGDWSSGNAPAVNVTFKIPMTTNKYSITMARGSSSGMILTSICQNRTTNGFSISNYCTGPSSSVSGWWCVAGY